MIDSAPLAPLWVVVVDSHEDNRAMYQALLQVAGWAPSVVASARDALACLRAGPYPHAVIFDVVLPDMTGFAFSEAMDALIGDTIPCRRIVVTGWILSAADRAALRRHGVTAIYEKPCDPEALLDALKR
jgi:CheY-like chemotaxis protein